MQHVVSHFLPPLYLKTQLPDLQWRGTGGEEIGSIRPFPHALYLEKLNNNNWRIFIKLFILYSLKNAVRDCCQRLLIFQFNRHQITTCPSVRDWLDLFMTRSKLLCFCCTQPGLCTNTTEFDYQKWSTITNIYRYETKYCDVFPLHRSALGQSQLQLANCQTGPWVTGLKEMQRCRANFTNITALKHIAAKHFHSNWCLNVINVWVRVYLP